MRYVVGSLVGAAVTAALVVAGSVDESSAGVEAPPLCEVYGHAMDDIIEERFPGSRDPVLLAKETGGVPLIGYVMNVRVPDIDWDCEERQLRVVVRGPWTLGADDMETALEVLLDDFRNRELRPVADGVVILLESLLVDGSARFDGAQGDLIESSARGVVP